MSTKSDDRSRDQLTRLRRELGRLKRQVRENEQIWAGFRHIEIDAIASSSLHELIYKVVRGIEEHFPNVDCVAVASINLDYEIDHLLTIGHSDFSIDELFIVLSDTELEDLFVDAPRPVLGASTSKIQGTLFPGYPHRLGSVALSPLMVGGRLIGCLAQGSRDPRHFCDGSATELLQHLSSTIALCIQNVVNNARLERYGLTDPLTGVANRRLLERRLREEVDRCRRYQHDLTCMMIDIDHFKRVNDCYGHAIGDRVLKDVAGLLGRYLRASDILSRYGGEEFVLLLPETGLEKGKLIAERHRNDIENLQLETDEPEPLTITVSIGVASLTADRAASEDGGLGGWLLEGADQALYEAKRSGRNKVVISSG